jgi:hypothetical protein
MNFVNKSKISIMKIHLLLLALITSFFISSCTVTEDLYVAPNFIANDNLPKKPSFYISKGDYYSENYALKAPSFKPENIQFNTKNTICSIPNQTLITPYYIGFSFDNYFLFQDITPSWLYYSSIHFNPYLASGYYGNQYYSRYYNGFYWGGNGIAPGSNFPETFEIGNTPSPIPVDNSSQTTERIKPSNNNTGRTGKKLTYVRASVKSKLQDKYRYNLTYNNSQNVTSGAHNKYRKGTYRAPESPYVAPTSNASTGSSIGTRSPSRTRTTNTSRASSQGSSYSPPKRRTATPSPKPATRPQAPKPQPVQRKSVGRQ